MKTTKLFTAALLASALFVSACAKQQFTVNGGGGRLAEDTTTHYFIEGIGQSHRADAASVCGSADRVASVEVERSAGNAIAYILTFGLYTPQQRRIYCTR